MIVMVNDDYFPFLFFPLVLISKKMEIEALDFGI